MNSKDALLKIGLVKPKLHNADFARSADKNRNPRITQARRKYNEYNLL